MSQNPFSKFVVDPSKVHDPNTMTAREFERYSSTEMQRIQSSLRAYKRSLVYLGGTAALMLVTAFLFNGNRRTQVLGTDNQGGSYLDLKTPHDESHYAYNRQFQRMMVLAEGIAPDQKGSSEKQLVDLGVNLPRLGNHNIPKKAPHEKYY